VLIDLIIAQSLPFNLVNSKQFKSFCNVINPAYSIPCTKTIKTIISEEYKAGVSNLSLYLESSCNYITITTDLWTAKSKDSYIGITGHWLTKEFEPCNILLTIEKIPYPHTGDAVSTYISNCLRKFSLMDKLVCIVTDNGKNMVLATSIINREFGKVERLACTAHTLQLTVKVALKAIGKQVARYKKLVKFFSRPKQKERLDAAQINVNNFVRNNFSDRERDINDYDNNVDDNDVDNGNGGGDDDAEDIPYPKIIRGVSEVKTRWNSKYISWKRLIKLKPAILSLNNLLKLSKNKIDKIDNRKLDRIMLCENEWRFMEDLIKLFAPFDELTTYFSGNDYVTISSILPLIESLKTVYEDKLLELSGSDDLTGMFLL